MLRGCDSIASVSDVSLWRSFLRHDKAAMVIDLARGTVKQQLGYELKTEIGMIGDF